MFPHSEIRARCGDRVSGVRIHVFLSNDGPIICRAIWKINVGSRDSDNFEHGLSGNLLAAVDHHSGVVERVISGIGLKQLESIDHPLTKMPLKGFRLPYWEATANLVLRAAVAFPGYICQGWDIAICESGPVLLELNGVGDIDLSQHSHRRGFLDPEFTTLLDKLGLAHLISGPAGPCRLNHSNGRRGRRREHWKW